MAYILDANVFIDAKKKYYDLGVCPAFWDWLIQQGGAGRVFSIEQVREELMQGTDELADWAKGHEELFMKLEDSDLGMMNEIFKWVQGQGFVSKAIDRFRNKPADCSLIAYSKTHDHILVTHETFSDTKKRVKIPTVCTAMGVKFTDPFEMLRRERPRFVLEN
ncbi:MAG: DUF4411 family protein [Gammaproteobacteria bacterium AqS3]|nr:DUF4411 family protein [Gammaproteobacteria bacterium AqS3]